MKSLPIALVFLFIGMLALAQDQPSECCFDATCIYCEDIETCETQPFFTPADATVGGTGACGIEIGILCSSYSENNILGGDCLPSCNDPAACNYDAQSPSDLDCVYAEECEDCTGECLNDVNNNDLCDCFETFGCTDSTACNFNPLADAEDLTCVFPEFGFDCDGNCLDDDGDGICLLDELFGCTDSLALNYYPFITEEDGSCIYASDFIQDCETGCPNPCPGDLNGDGFVTVADILALLGIFAVPCPE